MLGWRVRESHYLSCNPKSSKAEEGDKNSAFSGKWDCGRWNNDCLPPPIMSTF